MLVAALVFVVVASASAVGAASSGFVSTYTGVTSAVVSAPPPGEELTPAQSVYLVPHEAIRGMLFDVDALLQTAFAAEPPAWKLDTFCSWYNAEFFNILSQHHEGEEAVFFPWLETHGIRMENHLVADHRDLNDRLFKLQETCASTSMSAAERAKSLREQWTSLSKMMTPHLKAEEEGTLKPMQERVADEEIVDIINEVIAHLGLDGNAKFLPMIIHFMNIWGGVEFANGWISNLPPPVQILLKFCWGPEVEAKWSNLLMIHGDVPPPGPPLSWKVTAIGGLVSIVVVVIFAIRLVCCRSKSAQKPASGDDKKTR